MSERASVFQTVQIGVEAALSPGTEVDANKKLPSVAFEIGPAVDIKTYRGAGYKYAAIAAMNREWVEASISGPATYNEIVYLLSSALDAAVIVDNTGTTGQATWTFTPDPDAEDAPKTFTIEQGGAGRAHLFTGAIVTGLGVKFSGDGVEIDGTVLGKALQDGITMTAGATEVALIPLMAPQVKVYLDATWAALGGTQLTRVLSVEWNISDRFGPVWALTGTTDYAATVETAPNLEIKMMVEADAAGMALLTAMRAGTTKFLRIEATGATISAGPAKYKATFDTAVKVTDVEPFSDEDGVYAIEWTFNGFLDTTSGKVTEVAIVNTLGAL